METRSLRFARCLLLAGLLGVAACSTPPPAPAPAPAPVVEAPAVAAPPPGAVPPPPALAEQITEPFGPGFYKIWYATNRMPVIVNGEIVDYSAQRNGSKVLYGSIFAEIPDDFLKQQSKSGFLARKFRTSEAKLRLTKPIEVDATTFIAQLKEGMTGKPADERQLLLYLHGFNTTFKEAAQRAASIGYQLKMPTTAFYSWPSSHGLKTYVADMNAARFSEDSIADFIVKAQRESGATKVHIIAHSMGNQALLGAMQRPQMQLAIGAGLRFGQVILAAPDVDTDLFMRDVGVLAAISDRVSMYVSDGDKALKASVILSPKPGRAGLRPPVVMADRIDTVDVSSTNLTLLGHAYISTEVAVLSDMHAMIFHNEPPGKRSGIREKVGYWELH